MGLFGRRSKTTVEKTHKRTTLSKIIKFTYLQTLAVDGGAAAATDVARETEAKEATDINQSTNKDKIEQVLDNDIARYVGNLFGDLGGSLNRAIRGLFGKKTSTDVKVDVKESGWTLTKTWNQPQFDIIRYSIGIKELTVAQFTYETVSEVVSKAWVSPKEISKVVLSVDQFIPNQFPAGTYIKYYIKPNKQDTDFIQINPLGLPSMFNEDGTIVPRIINFNTEKPISSRLEDAYFYTEAPVKEIVFKAVLSRPDTLENSTLSADGYSPVLKSYRLLLYPKNGL